MKFLIKKSPDGFIKTVNDEISSILNRNFDSLFPEYIFTEDMDKLSIPVEIQEKEGATFLHPYDDLEVMAGLGTIGIEILEDLPTVDMVLVPAGGGGLVAGVAACIKQINPRVQIVGVQAEGAPAIYNSF